MQRIPTMTWLLLVWVAPTLGQELLTPPKAAPPEVAVAEAFPRAGTVVVRLLVPQNRAAPVQREQELEGKKVTVTEYTLRFHKWLLVELPVDGRQVQAFDVQGKAIDPQQLLKRLAKPSPVLLFKGDDPDPYYLRLLRPDSVIITAPQHKFTPPPPRP